MHQIFLLYFRKYPLVKSNTINVFITSKINMYLMYSILNSIELSYHNILGFTVQQLSFFIIVV